MFMEVGGCRVTRHHQSADRLGTMTVPGWSALYPNGGKLLFYCNDVELLCTLMCK